MRWILFVKCENLRTNANCYNPKNNEFQISWSIVKILFEIKLWLTHYLVQWNICIRTEIHLHLFQSFAYDCWLNQSIPLQHAVWWNDSGTVLVHVEQNLVHQWYFFEKFPSVAFHVHLLPCSLQNWLNWLNQLIKWFWNADNEENAFWQSKNFRSISSIKPLASISYWFISFGNVVVVDSS